MTFTLPPLPYAHDALGPHMSKETLEYHHDKHHQAYVTNGNNAIKGTEFEGKSLEEIVKGSYNKNAAVFNNAGQHYNHIHFWKWMKPNGGGSKLPGRLEKKINEDLGGLEKFKTDFAAAGVGQFGSGWCWLQVKNGKLEISKTPNGENPLVHGATPDPRLRRLGAFLLHRLPQPPSGLPEGVRRSSRQLGLCRRDVRQGGLNQRHTSLRGRSDEAIQSLLLGAGLLRFARNDEEYGAVAHAAALSYARPLQPPCPCGETSVRRPCPVRCLTWTAWAPLTDAWVRAHFRLHQLQVAPKQVGLPTMHQTQSSCRTSH